MHTPLVHAFTLHLLLSMLHLHIVHRKTNGINVYIADSVFQYYYIYKGVTTVAKLNLYVTVT